MSIMRKVRVYGKTALPFFFLAFISGGCPAGEGVDSSPEICTTYASPYEMNVNDSTTIFCIAIDADQSPGGCSGVGSEDVQRLTYQWSCTGGSMASDTTVSPEVKWYAPADTGTYYIKVSVSDESHIVEDSTYVQVYQGVNFLNGDVKGTLPEGLYIVNGAIWVQPSDSLAIAPGTVLRFDNYNNSTNTMAGNLCLMDIYGKLTAEGNETDSIYFISNVWQEKEVMIRFYNAVEGSALRYCNFLYENLYAEINNSDVTVENCYFGEGGCGMQLRNCNSIVENCRFSNLDDYAISIYEYYHYGPAQDYIQILNCRIYNNSGGINCSLDARPTIKNCIIAGSEDVGLKFYESGAAAILNNTIYQNGFNTNAISIENSEPEFTNNLIYHYGQGNSAVYIKDSPSVSEFNYNCVYCNWENVFSGEYPDNWGILCGVNANGDSCDVGNNIYMNPLLQEPPFDQGFNLTASSPCIDAGNPAWTDADGTVSDMGAVYFPH